MLAPKPRHPNPPPSITSTIQSTTYGYTSSITSSSMRPGRAGTSTSTSVFSDDGTEIPVPPLPYEKETIGKTRNRTPPLIDLDDDDDDEEYDDEDVHDGHLRNGPGTETAKKKTETPGDKLRLLLRQMEAEVRSVGPVIRSPEIREEPSPEAQARMRSPRAAWRDGRRRLLNESLDGRSKSRSVTPPSSPEKGRSSQDEHEDDADESPPTPPPRISNPYSSRRVSNETRNSPTGRIPSRAAVLHASTSRTTPSPPPPSSRHPKSPLTPLETFLQSHSKAPQIPLPLHSSPPHPHPTPHRRRSTDSTSPTKKGKERVIYPNTPRQRTVTVDTAPETSISFVEGLDERDEVEVDISEEVTWDDDIGLGEDSDEDEDDPQMGRKGSEPHYDLSNSNSDSRHDRTARGGFTAKADMDDRNVNTSFKVISPPSRERRRDILPALPEPEIELGNDEEEDFESKESPAMRRRSFFRSPSKPIPSPSVSAGGSSHSIRLDNPRSVNSPSNGGMSNLERVPSIQSPSKSDHSKSNSSFRTIPLREIDYPTSPPRNRQEHSASQRYTPPKPALTKSHNGVIATSSSSNGNASISTTPRPPGGWRSTPSALRHVVRFPSASPSRSPSLSLSHNLEDDGLADNGHPHGDDEGEISVHRVRVSHLDTTSGFGDANGRNGDASLRLSSSRSTITKKEGADLEGEADTSFSGRLKSISRALMGSSHPIPPPSKTYHEAESTLLAASKVTEEARENLEKTQRQWLDVISSIRISASGFSLGQEKGDGQGGGGVSVGDIGKGAVAVVSSSWGWGSWTWWFLVEVLLIWSVFRLTLDYASSTTYLSTFDPFHPSSQLDPSRLSLSLPLLDVFKLDHQASSNFFDVLESVEIWRRVPLIGSRFDLSFLGRGSKGFGMVGEHGRKPVGIGGIPS